ncbi:MAG: hypothetical protein NTX08_05765 [Sphingobacteriales bacterium]|nr:hypothetical protein [Sphingobacteriales bacterium]
MNIKSLLFSSSVFFTLAATAQDAGKTYAITGDGNGDFLWMNIRQVDVSSGKWMQDVYQRDKTAFVLTDAVSKTPVNSAYGNAPTASMVAAAAYDKQHDKLFFTPMRLGELRWLDSLIWENYTMLKPTAISQYIINAPVGPATSLPMPTINYTSSRPVTMFL